MSNIPTIGGRPSRGETFTKLLHHLREAQDMAAVMSHLSNTEDGSGDRLHAQGWLAIEELIKRMVKQITELAMKGIQ